MALSVEVLRGQKPSPTADNMLSSMAQAIRQAGHKVRETSTYTGSADVLLLFGVGATSHNLARNQHVASGLRVLMMDIGYFSRKKITGYVRMSIDSDHPQQWLDATPSDPSRFLSHGIQLREDYSADGPIILVGLGRKARSYLGLRNWEASEYQRIKRMRPGRRIILRPKPGHPIPILPCERDERKSIEGLLKGASLVVAKHSNVCVDATIAGVPFEATDGAAMWLKGKPFTRENRADFLNRLAWWQWKPTEASEAWDFAKRIMSTKE